jgi:ornithine cyclodeaminase/alanine dehydrogenase-like protein (mu-crystallin family)
MYESFEVGKEILFLSETDVKKVLNMKNAIKLCEEGERLTGLGEASEDKFYLNLKNGLVFKPFAGYLKSKDIVAAKFFTLAVNNPKKGFPASTSVGMIYDSDTLIPLSVVCANWLTGVKVGASSAVAAKYLAKRNSNIVAIIGAGIQGRTHLEGLNEIFSIDEVRIADISKPARMRYAEEMNEILGIKIKPVNSVEEAVKGADIIVTVTTADEPLIKKEWIEPGMTILKLGSYQEIDPSIITYVDKFVVDKWDFVSHRSKEVIELLENRVISESSAYAEIPEVVAGKKAGRENNYETILFMALGLGGDYVSIFSDIFRCSLEQGVGQRLQIY